MHRNNYWTIDKYSINNRQTERYSCGMDVTALLLIDEPHLHKQKFVGTFHGTSLLWSTV
ncbi:MAG: hypothetical protein F6K01_29635 [Okeania sp. SIO1I7]|nr:hypothetical protein [Okeania sp. SIO1I7]